MKLTDHPCFNADIRHRFGRVHLPVAPRCNIQCKFCNRSFDCVNESRPGVASTILTPEQALAYLEQIFQIKRNIAVVGIAGPGDPFANPEETLSTLRLVREKYPEILLCLASNGLNLPPHLDDLARLGVSHVTVTVNAVDPEIGSRIYSWVRHGPRVLRAEEGVKILLKNQLAAIQGLKERGIAVKVNSIVLPGINEEHIEAVAREMAGLKVDIFNCVPYYPCKGSTFAHLHEPAAETIHRIREKAGQHISQMHHCTRCRADAAGLLGEPLSLATIRTLRQCAKLPIHGQAPIAVKERVAVASREGILVNQHLGEAEKLLVYEFSGGKVTLADTRPTPEKGTGMSRWEKLAETIDDCRTLLVSGIGSNPRSVLTGKGIEVVEMEAVIEEAVLAVCTGKNIRHLMKPAMNACGASCSGSGVGCS